MGMALYGGLDPSYSGCACVLVDEGGELVQSTTIAAPKAEHACHPARLIHIREQVVGFFDSHGPRVIAIEGYSMGSKFGREMAGELGGVLRVALWEAGYSYCNVAPGTLKKFVTGKGVAKKDVMMREVFRTWGYTAIDDNDNDAFALAQLALKGYADEDASQAFRKLFEKVEIVDV